MIKKAPFLYSKMGFLYIKKRLFMQQKGAFFVTPIKDKNDGIKRGNIFIKVCNGKVRRGGVLRAGRKKAMTE